MKSSDEFVICISNSRENAVTFEDVASGGSFINPDSFFNSLTYVIGLSLFASAFLLFPLVERVTNAKQVNNFVQPSFLPIP